MFNKNTNGRLRKFTFGNNGAEFTHDVLIKYQAMTCGFNIPLLRTQSKPGFSFRTNSCLFILGYALIYNHMK